MKLNRIIILLFGLVAMNQNAIAQKTFATLDELLEYAKTKSTSIQSGAIKTAQAKKAKLAAIVGVFDPTGSQSFSFTDNTKIPVQVIGGQQVETGVQYVSNFNQYGEIKLLNLAGWENLNLAKINLKTTDLDNKSTLKSLYENIASSYYNIINLNEQIKSTEENLKAAETLLKTAESKYMQGTVKQQDVNDTRASFLTTKENVEQLKLMLQQQYLALKILTDIPETENILINQTIEKEVSLSKPDIIYNDLNVNNSMLKEKYAFSSYRQTVKTQWPTLNFFVSNTSQQFNTQFKLFDSNVDWIKSAYIGAKLTMTIPTATSISQKYKAKYDYELAQKNTEHTKIKADLEFKQLGVDYEKALSQSKTNAEIFALRKDTYEKNQKLYAEGLLGIDQTINSYNAMVNGNYSLISSNVNVLLALSKIDINNNIK